MSKKDVQKPEDYSLTRAKVAAKHIRDFLYGFESEPDMMLMYKGEPLEVRRVYFKLWVNCM